MSIVTPDRVATFESGVFPTTFINGEIVDGGVWLCKTHTSCSGSCFVANDRLVATPSRCVLRCTGSWGRAMTLLRSLDSIEAAAALSEVDDFMTVHQAGGRIVGCQICAEQSRREVVAAVRLCVPTLGLHALSFAWT